MDAEQKLPHGETPAQFRLDRAKAGVHATELRRTRYPAGEFKNEAGWADYELLVEASSNAWSVVALLKWVDQRFGAEAAFEAAAIAQEIGINGVPMDVLLTEDAWEAIGGDQG